MNDLLLLLLGKLKQQKGIDPDNHDQDAKLQFILERLVWEVLEYCHLTLDEFPLPIINVIVQMALDVMNEQDALDQAKAGGGNVTKLTEGDFSISMNSVSDVYTQLIQSPSFIRNYKQVLNRYRRFKR